MIIDASACYPNWSETIEYHVDFAHGSAWPLLHLNKKKKKKKNYLKKKKTS